MGIEYFKVNDKKKTKNVINLNEKQRKGRDEIKEGIKNKGWMLSYTDKSGKLVLDTIQNHLEAMKPHAEIKESIKNKGCVLSFTDKSGKLVLDTIHTTLKQ